MYIYIHVYIFVHIFAYTFMEKKKICIHVLQPRQRIRGAGKCSVLQCVAVGLHQKCKYSYCKRFPTVFAKCLLQTSRTLYYKNFTAKTPRCVWGCVHTEHDVFRLPQQCGAACCSVLMCIYTDDHVCHILEQYVALCCSVYIQTTMYLAYQNIWNMPRLIGFARLWNLKIHAHLWNLGRLAFVPPK